MKTKLLWVLITLLFALSCKKSTKENISTTKVEIKQVNQSISKKDKKTKSLQEKLIGKKYHLINEIDEFKNSTSSGIFPIGDLRLNKNGFGIEKIYKKTEFTHLIFSKVNNFSTSNNDSVVSEILDVLNLTGQDIARFIKSNDASLFLNSSYLEGKFDDEIITIAKYEDDNHEYYTTIYKAWRADRKIKKIIEIPTTGIKVENMDYGL